MAEYSREDAGIARGLFLDFSTRNLELLNLNPE
jgi:hypothetical protein